MLYTIPTARVIFMVKTSLDVLSLRGKHLVLVDCISRTAKS